MTAAEKHLETANAALKAQGALINYVSNAVGQLSKLNALGGAKSYYVRLACGKTQQELARYESDLLARFPGAKKSKPIEVRANSTPKGCELIFGTGLTLASAEVFQRMASMQGFASGRTEIRPED